MEQQVIAQIVLAYLAIGWAIMFFLSRKMDSRVERITVILLAPVIVAFMLLLAFLVMLLFGAVFATAFGF